MDLTVDAERHPVIFMCLGTDIGVTIPEKDEPWLRRKSSIHRVPRKAWSFRFGDDTSAVARMEGKVHVNSSAEDLTMNLMHGDVMMLRGCNRKVCPNWVVLSEPYMMSFWRVCVFQITVSRPSCAIRKSI